MGAFKIGDKFLNVQEYCDYPYSHLFFHGKVIGKAVTDNWQFRKIANDIKHDNLRKAELNEGYKLYEVTASVFDNFASKAEYVQTAKFVAKSVAEAEKKMIKYRLYGDCVSTGVEHEYIFGDESGIIKMRTVECDD